VLRRDRRSAGVGRLWLLAALLVMMGTFWPRDAHAYAWMIKHGYADCGTCHTDPSGGETLNHMGRVQSDLLLSFMPPEDGYPRNRAQFLFGLGEPDSVRLGGSLRAMSIYKAAKDGAESSFSFFPMQADFYGWADFGPLFAGGSLGYIQVPGSSPHGKAAQITSNAGDSPNVISRTHFIGFNLGDYSQVRVGRLNLPFGVRIPEHVMWAREATRTDRESDQQHGLAFDYKRGAWRSELMGIFGNYQISPDEVRERGYAGSLEYQVANTMAIGLSSMWTKAKMDRLLLADRGVVRNAHGLTGRLGFSKELAILFEADVLKSSGRNLGYTGFVQGDYEFLQGLHGMLTIEGVDEGKFTEAATTATAGAGKLRTGVWASAAFYAMSHVDFRLDLVIRQEDPFTAQSQVHIYF
jgi:hypothetical protein